MAINPVTIDFELKNVSRVAAAFRSIIDTITRNEKLASTTVERESELRARLVQKSVDKQISAYQQLAAAQAKAGSFPSPPPAMRIPAALRPQTGPQMPAASRASGGAAQGAADKAARRESAKASRDSEKAARAESRAAEQAAKDKVAAFKSADREILKARDAGIRAAEKAAREDVRITEKAERDKNAAAAQWVRKREQEVTTRRRQVANAIVGAGGKAVQHAGSVAYSAVKGIATGAASTAMNLGGGFDIQTALQDKISLERNAALLSNVTAQGEGTRVNKDDILATVRKTSGETGMDQADVLKGLNAFTAKTGNYRAGADNATFFAKMAKANGSSIESVMSTAGSMAVQNEDLGADKLGPAALRKLMLSTVMQSRKGSVEFDDMAKAGGAVTRSAISYAGDQADRQSELLGLSQVGMRTSKGNVAEAATSLANVSSDASKHKKDVEALLGHSFKDDKGRIKDGPSEFIAEIMRASGGNLDKIQSAGFGKQAIRTFQAVAPVYNKAEEAALAKNPKDRKAAAQAGKDAVLADIKKISATPYSEKDQDKDFAEVMSTAAESFERAIRDLKVEVADKLLPEFIKLIPVLQKLTPSLVRVLDGVIPLMDRLAPTIVSLLDSFSSIVNWAAKNPFEGFAALVGAFFMKELGAAGIGAAIKAAISGGVGGGGAAGGAGVAGSGLVMAGVALQVGSAANLIDERYGAVKAGQESAKGISEDLKSDDPSKRANAQKAVEDAKNKSGTIEKASAYLDTGLRGAMVALNPGAYVGQKLGDYAAEKIGPMVGGDGKSSASRSVETLKAIEIVDAPGIKEAMSKAVAEGIAAGSAQGGAGKPNNPVKPLGQRATQ